MRSLIVFAATMLFLNVPQAMAVDLEKLQKLGGTGNASLLDNVNESLARQQIKDGQFEFKTGKAEFAAGNEKRVAGLLKIITDNSTVLKTAFPKLSVVAEGHTDSDGNPTSNQKLSLERGKTVCAALKAKGMKLPCTATGKGSSKPLVSPEKTAADKQKNRRVLVQLAK